MTPGKRRPAPGLTCEEEAALREDAVTLCRLHVMFLKLHYDVFGFTEW